MAKNQTESIGFDLDDNEDLGSMFNQAASASSDSGDDSILHEYTNRGDHIESQVEEEPTQSEEDPLAGIDFDSLSKELEGDLSNEAPASPPVAVEVEEPSMAEPAYEPAPAIEQEPVPAPTPEPAPAPEPKASSGRIRVPSEQDKIAEVGRMVRVLDAYRKLTPEEKSVATQFVTGGEHEQVEDHVLVVKALNSDPLLAATMKALTKAYECEPVERAFYTISLETKILHSLGNLVTVFTSDQFDPSMSNIDYSRALVASISNLGEREISLVKATESVLSAAEIE